MPDINFPLMTLSKTSPSSLNLERQFFLKIFMDLLFKTNPRDGLTIKEFIFCLLAEFYIFIIYINI